MKYVSALRVNKASRFVQQNWEREETGSTMVKKGGKTGLATLGP